MILLKTDIYYDSVLYYILLNILGGSKKSHLWDYQSVESCFSNTFQIGVPIQNATYFK